MACRSLGFVAALFTLSGCGLVLDLDPPDQGMDAAFPDGGMIDASRVDSGRVDAGAPDGGQACTRNRECPEGDLCFAHSRCDDGLCSPRRPRSCPIPAGSCAVPVDCDPDTGCVYGPGSCRTVGYECVPVDDGRHYACRNTDGSCDPAACPPVPCGDAFCDSDGFCAAELECAEDEECCGDACVPAGCDDGNPCTEGSCAEGGCVQAFLVNTACHPDDALCRLGACTNAGICEPRGEVSCDCGAGGTCDPSTGDCIYGGGDPGATIACTEGCVRDGVCDASGNCVGAPCTAHHDCEHASCNLATELCVITPRDGDACGAAGSGAACDRFVCVCPSGLPAGPDGCVVAERDGGPMPYDAGVATCDPACGSGQQCCCIVGVPVCVPAGEPCIACESAPVE